MIATAVQPASQTNQSSYKKTEHWLEFLIDTRITSSMSMLILIFSFFLSLSSFLIGLLTQSFVEDLFNFYLCCLGCLRCVRTERGMWERPFPQSNQYNTCKNTYKRYNAAIYVIYVYWRKNRMQTRALNNIKRKKQQHQHHHQHQQQSQRIPIWMFRYNVRCFFVYYLGS